MKNKAFGAYLSRKNLLDKMHSFENMAMIKNEVEIEEMQKAYNELEEQVQLIKSETLEMEYKLNLVEDEISKKEKNIADIKHKNNTLVSDRNSIIQELFKENIKIIKIYQTLNVNSLNDIIEIFNNQKFMYQSNYSQFNNLNKEIVDLNILYTEYEKDLQIMDKKITLKKAKDSHNEGYKTDIEVVDLELVLMEIKDSIEEDISKIAIMEKIFIKLKKDFDSYDKKLSYIINSINYLNAQKIKEKDLKEVNNHYNPSLLPKEKSSKFLSTKIINNLVQLKELMPNDIEWNGDNSKNNFFQLCILQYLYCYLIFFNFC